MALNGRCSVKRQQICLRLGTIQPNMPPGPLEIKEKSYLTNVPPSHCETLLAKTATLSIQHTCHVESCYVAAATTYMPCRVVMLLQLQHTCRVESCYVTAAATYMPAGLVLLSQTPLLFKHAYWLSTAARWMLAGLWPFCHSILHVCSRLCWRCVSLSAGMMSHYQPCLLV